ncbi:hypothetical protein PGT21_013262 [Puccinia graminis f. sp. tritici]|uniref:Uncharacterized protein n=1 Tax=Puccinia graminis f. sp. tritici TaxID=56615 RepID=A0A5B0NY36_PUCGR|nr:hypothetical protein PGTUg99_016384 [Puccinia graminis f. sp. tritici]KAA1092759.1 hypothetical protein PGT21_013262 [Puccinia graminis f. sp. tritici]
MREFSIQSPNNGTVLAAATVASHQVINSHLEAQEPQRALGNIEALLERMEARLNGRSVLREERIITHIDETSQAMEQLLTAQIEAKTTLVEERIMAHWDERFEEVNATMAGI